MNDTGVASSATVSRALDQRLGTALWVLLCIFVLALPLAEAPKNIAGGLFLLLWLLRAVCAWDFGGRWDRFDTAFACMLASAAISAWAGREIGDLSGVVRTLGVAWVCKRVPLCPARQRGLLGAACLSLAVALALAAFPFIEGHKTFLELPSVGHVNQSALYIAVLACAALGWSLQGLHWGRRWLACAAVSAVLFGVALLVTASRAAILAYGVFAAGALLALLWQSRRSTQARRLFVGVSLALLSASALVLLLGERYPQLADKKLQAAHWVNVDSVDHRFRHWHLAIDGWRQKPWLGFGPDAFHVLDPQQVCAWKAERGEACDPQEYSVAPHAHSLYFSMLVERGLVGVAALSYFLWLWLWALLTSARQASWSSLWAGSAAGFVVVVIAGLFNTTLRVEHGSLALLLLGVWLAAAPARSRSGA
jgi:O-antigen ligase